MSSDPAQSLSASKDSLHCCIVCQYHTQLPHLPWCVLTLVKEVERRCLPSIFLECCRHSHKKPSPECTIEKPLMLGAYFMPSFFYTKHSISLLCAALLRAAFAEEEIVVLHIRREKYCVASCVLYLASKKSSHITCLSVCMHSACLYVWKYKASITVFFESAKIQNKKVHRHPWKNEQSSLRSFLVLYWTVHTKK